jgi:hypothetical protein
VPLLDLGYRKWEGERTPRALRWLVVTITSALMIWRGYWLRTILALSLSPIIFTVIGFFFFEQGLQDPEARMWVSQVIGRQFRMRELGANLMTNPENARHEVWSLFLLTFFKQSQVYGMVVVLGLTAPRLISYDLRSRAYLLYLSRPLSPAEYLLGKASVLWFLLLAIATAPALCVYFFGVLISPTWTVVLDTWDLPLRILAATAALALPTSALAIFYSSMTTESRFAGFAWFATWIVGWVTYSVLTSVSAFGEPNSDLLPDQLHKWEMVSPYHTLGQVQSIIFGANTENSPFWLPIIICSAVTIGGFFMAHRRIAGMLRA